MRITKGKIKELIELCHQLEKLFVQVFKSLEHILISLCSCIGWLLILICIIKH
ncbi:TPA: hypothetical protein KOO95_001137 [Clostridioides difficile]|uniref:hypothetical protein n=1 Tax=Clostridioides difficile TaxID=1496 RepID=UPI00190E6CC3|nr:hypothetical protein [Clostridioides difficile]HBF4731957.1 hypothetical protein [Clostridioides difficile]HBH1323572.1 hypothetical protein [Clostridioides difficile]HBY3102417.1 hypothetical protein [Clostridioides difficile]HBY3297312.1 hypothetical protein [Clostridioides difficile]HBY3644591.1 hypothetical protein [Clostridioides difficile]